ncbi:MAG: serine protease [Microgenomates group bacterium]
MSKSDLGGCVFRFLVTFVLAFHFAAPAAGAFTADQLQLEFDARLLTAEEKRFLQAGLAFANAYNGMIDGAWGQGSQRALERYEVRNGRSEFVTNADVLFLALDAYTILEKDGWVRQYNSALDMSFLVPTVGFVAGAPNENFINMELAGTSLGYSLTVGDGYEAQPLHEFTAQEATGEVYQVRKPLLWITSARTVGGLSLYTRSDFRQGLWSTIMLSAQDNDAGALSAVTGSIQPGFAQQIGISPGVLATGIETMSAMLDDGSTGQVAAAPAPVASPPVGAEEPTQGFGTGFLVSSEGDFVTNNHVVKGCGTVSIDGILATVVATDEAFDLALLRVSPAPMNEPATFAEKPARLNSDVTVIGYPLPDLLGGLNVTRGSVTSLKGIAGDGVRMQISAPVQPGNSGGPVVNAAGQVVGVVVSKLDAQLVADATGDIPQDINFAIRAEIAKLFLYQNGVEPVAVQETDALAPEDLAEAAKGFTRLITCK